MNNFIIEYWQDIENGSIIVGKWIRMLYQKIVMEIDDGTLIFDQKKANLAIRFIEGFMHHNKGAMAPKLLTLSLWQKALVSMIFGIVDENGKRHFREVFVEVGRKCGKTLLAAGIMEYMVYGDGEYGGEIYCVAPRLDQSDLVYSAFRFSVEHEPALEARTKSRKADLFVAQNNTSIKKIAFNEKKADGYNPQLTVADEMSSWPAERGLKQYEVMVSGTGAREQPITLSISSAGYVDEGIFDELCKRGTAYLTGDSRESRLLPVMYQIDDVGKWDDINELRKSMPGLGTSVSTRFMLDQIDIAYGSMSKKTEFLAKYCDIKQNSSQAWLSAEAIRKCVGSELRLEDFEGCYCVGGIDLSQTTDLTACCIVIERAGRLHVITKFFLPREKIAEATARDQLPYEAYIKRGILIPSGDNFIDYTDCRRWYTDLIEKYRIYPLKVGYDRYSAQYLVQELKGYGFHMADVYQGENLTGIINETEGRFKDGCMDIGDNDLLKVHCMDSAIKLNAESNRKKLIKLQRTRHVDGMAALLDAMCMRAVYYEEVGEQLRNGGKGIA